MKVQNVTAWNLSTLSSEQYAQLLERAETDMTEHFAQVKPIIERVRDQGDAALAAFAAKFDGASGLTANDIRVPNEEIEAAEAAVEPALREAIVTAADNVRTYHQFQCPKPMSLTQVSPGVFAGERWDPIDRVACYVPRGKGKFPSVALMTAIPAVAAGVKRPIIITPPGPDGSVDPATLLAAQLAGVDEVYRSGGAQGVAAVAYGTQTVPKCDKIVGPGSLWVTAARRQLTHLLDPGPPAGPSEAIVIADADANPWKVALDLVNESEHGPDSSVFLLTTDPTMAAQVDQHIADIWAKLSEGRRMFSQTVLQGSHGGIVLCETFEQLVQFSNDYAPEHLQVHSSNPFSYLDVLRHAGEILLGEHTPISLGNFVLGPNAVLPTNGSARTHSPLSVYDYMKRTSIAYATQQGYERLAPHAETLATYEGFDAHSLAVSALRNDPAPAKKK